jgi:hypothetical protein
MVLGLPVPYPAYAWYVQKLNPHNHWTGAQIPCSYHVSNPFKDIV